MTNLSNNLFLIDQTPGSGTWNMACDEWLLQQAMENELIAFRFYRWEEPTLSLGYFQEKSGTQLSGQFESLPRVRRLSGGGAILHDIELTYSLVIPASHRLASTPVKLYDLIHDAMIEQLGHQGVSTQRRGFEQKEINGRFLCFLRGDCHDLVIGTNKILGSAQRRRKGAILQHGSLILKQSALAPEILGISELTGVELDQEKFISEFPALLGELSPKWNQIDSLPSKVKAEISKLEHRYGKD